jgi:hypothetical protein
MVPICANRPAIFPRPVLGILLPADTCPDVVQACRHGVQRNFELADSFSDLPKNIRIHFVLHLARTNPWYKEGTWNCFWQDCSESGWYVHVAWPCATLISLAGEGGHSCYETYLMQLFTFTFKEVWLAFYRRWLGGARAHPIAQQLCAGMGCAERP